MADKKAFTLVELIVGVTISMLLMTSVGVLVSGGMQNILKQQKIMQKNSLLTTSVSDFYNGFNNISQSGGYIHYNASGALFKINQNIQKGGFGYFGIISQDNQYCSTDSDLPTLDYLTWKTFIPYEEIDEDIMDTYSDTTFQEVFTGSITYKVDTLNHIIYENNGGGDIIIIGGDVFGHEFTAGADGTDVRLNNPTGIVLAEGGFFFSDTLNHRVLFYEDGKVSLILDKNDGLSEPTGLAYDNSKKNLYIANSGKGEILKYSSEKILTNPDLKINFSPNKNIIDVTRFTLNFGEDITGPSNSGAYTSGNPDYTRIENGNYEYYFSNYLINDDIIIDGFINNCNSNVTFMLNGTTPEKRVTTCDTEGGNTGSLIRYTGNVNQNFLSNTYYTINLTNVLPLFSTPKNHLVELELFDNSAPIYNETFTFFTQGDEEVKNGKNMMLSIFVNDLKYPTGLKLNGGNLKVNEFSTRNILTYNLDGTLNSTDPITLKDFTAENFAQFNYSSLTDTILENPISDISVSYDIPTRYFSTNIQYYQFINCYNSDERVEKTLIFSKDMQ